MSMQPDLKYIYDSLLRIEQKIDNYTDKQTTYVTKKESNIKTAILAAFTLISTGILKFQDILTFIKLH